MIRTDNPDLRHIIIKALDLGSGPLRVAVKDCVDIAGTVTGCGSAVFADAPPAQKNAALVTRLLDRGARIVGKANMHEFAYGVTGINGWHGTPVNPYFPDRVPGGSSSGSAAAVAAGLADIAIGTDTGGSIRVPAACCGVFGLKPTFGRVSRAGLLPADSSLDCAGPLARTMEEIVEAMDLLEVVFQCYPWQGPLHLGRVAAAADTEVDKAFERALAATGATVARVELPSFVDAFDAGMAVIARETFEAVGDYIDHPGLGEDVRARLKAAGQVSDGRVAWAEEVRSRFTEEVDLALQSVDALVLPTLPIVPPSLIEAQDGKAALRLTELVRPFNLSGHPAVTMPIETSGGLPAGFQIVAEKFEDEKLCSIGLALAERITVKHSN
jgi:amidase